MPDEAFDGGDSAAEEGAAVEGLTPGRRHDHVFEPRESLEEERALRIAYLNGWVRSHKEKTSRAAEAAELTERLAAIETSWRYRLASALMEGVRSARGASRLLPRLADLGTDGVRHVQALVRRRRTTARASEAQALLDRVVRDGTDAAVEWAGECFPSIGKRAAVIAAAADLLQQRHPHHAARMLAHAFTLLDDLPTGRRAANHLRRLGALQETIAVMERVSALEGPQGGGVRYLQNLRGQARLLERGFPLPVRREPMRPGSGRGSLYCLHNSLPYATAGYAVRSHHLARELRRRGYDLEAATRHGYPADVDPYRFLEPTLAVPEVEVIDGVTYHRLPAAGTGHGQVGLDRYIRHYALALARLATERPPAVLHAASNFTNAMAALWVGRRYGIPVVYELRGLWEITRASRDPQWAESEYFRMSVRLETEAAKAADRVVALTGALGEEMIGRGVDARRISIAPNGVDADRFRPLPRDRDLARQYGLDDLPVAGYIGSLLDYEGLGTLVAAFARLPQKDARLLIVGQGPMAEPLCLAAERHGIRDRVIFTGAVPHERIQGYYSLLDVAVYPRRNWPVCRIVSPLKPLEAMASERPVIISDLPALRELVGTGGGVEVVPPEQTDALAAALGRMLSDRDECRLRGKDARRWVTAHRTWQESANVLEDVYSSVGLSRSLVS